MKDTMKKLLGKRIREIRNKKGLTQEKLAELVEINTPNISYIENGKFYPSYETFVGLVNALEIEPCELFAFDTMAKSPDELKDEMIEAFNKDEKLLRLIYKIYRAIAV